MNKTTLAVMSFVLCAVFTSCLTTEKVSAVTEVSPGPSQTAAQPAAEGEAPEPEPVHVPTPAPALPLLSLEAGKTPAQVRTGQTFKTSFTATVLDGETNAPATGTTVTVRYPESRMNDEITFAIRELTADEAGLCSFTPPATDFPCDGAVTFSVESRDGVQEVSVPYQVRTNRHNKGGTLSIVDYTKAGNPVRDNSRSASALLTQLIRSGFSGVGLVDFVNEIHAGDTARVYRAAYNLIGSSSNFFVFGTVKYNGGVTTEGATFSVPLVGELTCLEMKTGKELYHTVIEVVGTGRSEQAALDNARQEYARQAADRLIYGI